jgi:hypothetical protein
MAITIIEGTGSIVQVNTLGPQGIQGPIGPSGTITANSGANITGDITASGHISASGNLWIQEAKIFSDAIVNGAITASGDISASGFLSASNLNAAENMHVDGFAKIGNLRLNSNSIISTSDTEVFMTIGTAGFNFEANTGDKFIFNEESDDIDLKYNGENDEDLFYIDASADAVGIGTPTPGEKLHVVGNVSASNDASFLRTAVGDQTTFPKEGSPFSITGLPVYADNDAALAGGLEPGQVYRSDDFLKVVWQ